MSTATLQPPQANLAPPNLGDASRYSCVRNVPILDTHETQRDKDGKVTHYGVDLHRLKLLMRNGNARAARGNPAMVTLGHTHDEQDETTQPRPIGYCSRFQIGDYHGKPVLLADLCVETRYAAEASTYPRRSAEVWGQDSPEDRDHYIDVVALLRRAPNRELGLVTQYRMQGRPDRNKRAARPVWHVCNVPARYSKENCGTGKGGFKLGNTCGHGQGRLTFGKPEGKATPIDRDDRTGVGGSDLDKDVEAFRKKQIRPIKGQSSFLDCLKPSKRDEINRKIEEAAQANLKAAEGATTVQLESGEDNGINKILIHPSTKSRGKFQLTWFTGDDPAGDEHFESMEAAIRSASGARSEGPQIGHRGFRVTDRRPPAKPDRNASPLTPDRLISALAPDRHTIRREALARVVARYQMPVAASSCGAGAQGSPGFQRGNTCGRRGGPRPPIPATHAPAKAAPSPAPQRAKLIGDLRSIAAGHDENDHGQRRKMADAFAQRLSADLSDEDALNLARKVLPAGIASKLTDKASAIEAIRRGLAGKQPKEQLPAPAAPAQAAPTPAPPAPAPRPRPPKARTPKLGEKVQQARQASKPQRQAFVARLKAVAQAERAQGNDPTSHTDHAPGTVTMLKSDLVDFDPGRFQYKMGGSTKTGSVGSLGGVKKWDDELAGVIQVWKDPADGKTYVVNGHNRMDLAKKLGVPNVAVRFLAAKDADEAMAKGALTNIAEGRGTAIDAGNFFRRSGADRETLEAKGIPMRERVATVGLALAGLPDNLFNDVTTGDLTEEQGAAIGGAGLSPEQMVSVAKRAKEGDFSLGKLKEFVDLAKMAGSRSGNQASLFGGGGDDEALFEHRADLQSHIKRKLAGEKNIFKGASSARAAQLLSEVGNQLNVEGTKTAGDQAAMAHHLFSTLTKRAGSSAGRLMNRFATQMAEAKTARERKKLLDEAYGQVRDNVPMWLDELEDFGMGEQKPAAPSGPSMF